MEQDSNVLNSNIGQHNSQAGIKVTKYKRYHSQEDIQTQYKHSTPHDIIYTNKAHRSTQEYKHLANTIIDEDT